MKICALSVPTKPGQRDSPTSNTRAASAPATCERGFNRNVSNRPHPIRIARRRGGPHANFTIALCTAEWC